MTESYRNLVSERLHLRPCVLESDGVLAQRLLEFFDPHARLLLALARTLYFLAALCEFLASGFLALLIPLDAFAHCRVFVLVRCAHVLERVFEGPNLLLQVLYLVAQHLVVDLHGRCRLPRHGAGRNGPRLGTKLLLK